LRAYATTWIVLLAGAAFALVLAPILGRDSNSVLGTYETFAGNVDLRSLPWWIFLHLAAFDLFVVITPLAATVLVVVAGLRRDAETSVRLFAVIAPAAALPLLAVVSAYSTTVDVSLFGYAAGDGPQERATFVLAPLAFIGFVMWLRDRPGSRRLVAVAALAAGVLPAAIPVRWFELNVVRDQAFSLIPWERARDAIHWPIGVLVVGVLLAAAFIVLARIGADSVAFVAPVAVGLIAVTFAAQTFVELASDWSRSVGVGDSKSWVQRAAGGEPVSVLWYEPKREGWVQSSARHRVVWLNEFFNRNVDGVYELGSPMPYGPDLPSTRVRLREGEVVLADGSPANLGDYVLAPCFVHVDGDPVARDAATGATLYRVPAVVRATMSSWRSC
jgi:hypothetical protein